MNTNILITIAVIVVIIIGGFFLLGNTVSDEAMESAQTNTTGADGATQLGESESDQEMSDGLDTMSDDADTSTEEAGNSIESGDKEKNAGGAIDSGVSPNATTVTYTDSGFSPQTATINVGDTVTFVNGSSSVMWPASAIHPTHTIYPGSSRSKCGTAQEARIFDACRSVAPGDSWSFAFEEAGEWGYHNHLRANHKGTIIVQ